MYGPTPERLALAKRVNELVSEGFTRSAIAEQLEISTSYVYDLRRDPDGSKARARKDKYRGVCDLCGNPTCGSGGPAVAPSTCWTCANTLNHENRYWTRETIIAAFKEFERRTGRPPTAFARHHPPSQTKRFSPERLAEIKENEEAGKALPNASMVYREMGSWSAALLAAGMQPTPGGSSSHRTSFYRTEASIAVLSLLYLGPKTLRKLSEARGVRGSSTVAIVGRLNKLGMVAALRDERQRGKGVRAKIYRLTEKGVMELERAWTDG